MNALTEIYETACIALCAASSVGLAVIVLRQHFRPTVPLHVPLRLVLLVTVMAVLSVAALIAVVIHPELTR